MFKFKSINAMDAKDRKGSQWFAKEKQTINFIESRYTGK